MVMEIKVRDEFLIVMVVLVLVLVVVVVVVVVVVGVLMIGLMQLSGGNNGW